MKKKSVATAVLLTAFVLSAFSVWSILKDTDLSSSDFYSNSIECKAQGDFMPKPFTEELIAPSVPIEDDGMLFAGQGDYKPRPLDDDDDDDDDPKS